MSWPPRSISATMEFIVYTWVSSPETVWICFLILSFVFDYHGKRRGIQQRSSPSMEPLHRLHIRNNFLPLTRCDSDTDRLMTNHKGIVNFVVEYYMISKIQWNLNLWYVFSYQSANFYKKPITQSLTSISLPFPLWILSCNPKRRVYITSWSGLYWTHTVKFWISDFANLLCPLLPVFHK